MLTVDSSDQQVVEDVQHAICHMVVRLLHYRYEDRSSPRVGFPDIARLRESNVSGKACRVVGARQGVSDERQAGEGNMTWQERLRTSSSPWCGLWLVTILDIPGLTGVFPGPKDLAGSLGHFGDFRHPEVQALLRTVEAAAARRGLILAGAAGTVDEAASLAARGYGLITLGADAAVLARSLASAVGRFHELMKEPSRCCTIETTG